MTREIGTITRETKKVEIKPSTQSTQSKLEIPVIDQNICRGWMVCARHCPEGAVQRINGYAVINPELCTNCKNCVAGCPLEAIN